MIYPLELSRLIVAGLLLLAILALAYRPRLLPLVAVAAIALIYGPIAVGRVQQWNTFHYWINAKYWPELGYFDLYNCAAAAAPALFGDVPIRNLETYDYEPAGTAAAACPRDKFTPARWAEFQHDLTWLHDRPGNRAGIFQDIIRDKGLNTTPAWLAIAAPFANVAAGSPIFWAGLYGDSILLIIALALLAKVRGLRPAALAAISLTTWIGTAAQLMGHWFQYLWLALLIVALVAWQRRKWATAGAAIALAAALRIFPGVLFVWPLLHPRQTPRRFWIGAMVAGGLAVAGGSFTPAGLSIWPDFLAKMSLHSAAIALEPGNMGIRNLAATIAQTPAALAVWDAFALGKIAPDLPAAAPAWTWIFTAVFGGLALVAIARRQSFQFGDGLMLIFPGLVLSRYYYAWLSLNIIEADANEAAGLLLLNLVGVVAMYWLHPLVAYQVTQALLLVYLYRRSTKCLKSPQLTPAWSSAS